MTKAELEALLDSRIAMAKTAETPAAREALEESIRTAVEAQLAPLQKKQTDWMERMLTNGQPPKPTEPTLEKGQAFGLYVRAIATARYETAKGSPVTPEAVALRWGHKKIADEMAESRTKALAATDLTAGGFLVPTTFSQDVIEYLRPQSAVRKMNPMVIPMPTGSLRIPKVTAGATAAYQGENANITASQQTLGQIVLSFKKLTALVPISNDLLRYSSPAADGMVRDDVVRALAQTENQYFIRGDGTAGTPRGLLGWALAANKVASAGTSLANMNTDMGTAIQVLREANIPMLRGGWVMSPRTFRNLTTIQNTNGFYAFRAEMLGASDNIGGGAMGVGPLDSRPQGTLWGYPYIVSTGVPATGTLATGELYLVDFNDVVIGESQSLIVDASMEAAYVDSGGSTVAAFSQDQTVIRAITEHDLGVRRQESIYVVTTMSW